MQIELVQGPSKDNGHNPDGYTAVERSQLHMQEHRAKCRHSKFFAEIQMFTDRGKRKRRFRVVRFEGKWEREQESKKERRGNE